MSTDGHLRQLAVNRGCRYYCEPFDFPAPVVDEEQFSNEELAVSLLHPSMPYLPQNLRVGAAIASAEGNDPLHMGTLALGEGAATALGFVAECGKRYEPGNAFWTILARVLGESPVIPDGVMPHPTRFVAMTGITRKGVGLVTQWIRPWPVGEIVRG